MNKDKKKDLASDVSKGLYLLSTGQPVIDMGRFKVSKSGHEYREVLVPYNETEMRCRSNLDKRHHHLIIRSEKLGTKNN